MNYKYLVNYKYINLRALLLVYHSMLCISSYFSGRIWLPKKDWNMKFFLEQTLRSLFVHKSLESPQDTNISQVATWWWDGYNCFD